MIARNLYLHELRHLRRRMPLDEAMASADAFSANLEAKEKLARVVKALAALPEVDRFALLLRAVEGLSYTEIAATLRITIAAAKVKIHRARLRLASQGLGGIDNEHIERRQLGIPLTQPTTTCRFGQWRITREPSRSSRRGFRPRTAAEHTW